MSAITHVHSFRFKKIDKREPLALAEGFFTNREWVFKTDWLLAMKTKITIGLRAAIARKTLEVVNARLSGATVNLPTIQTLIQRIELSTYKRVVLTAETFTKKIGYRHGKFENKGVVAFTINAHRKQINVDPEYFTALFFDATAEIHIRDEKSPIVILKNSEIVGLIMPLQITKEK